jgi:hypothetical protein
VTIAICTPVHGSPRAEYTYSLARLCIASTRPPHSIDVEVIIGGHPLVQRARMELLKAARQMDASHMLFIDADQSFPPDALIRLLQHEKPVIAANYGRRYPPFKPVTQGMDGGVVVSTPGQGIEQVGQIGLGLCLIELAALDVIDGPLFEVIMLPSGEFQGEDGNFCAKLRAAGIPIFVDHDLSCEVGHVGDYTVTYQDTLRSLAGQAVARHKAQAAE